jgi:3,4-dihydroxy-2-butanone 4-phosphate synthase
VMDDESRENEGDLMLPAQFATTEKFAFLVRHSRYIKVPRENNVL